MEDLSNYKESLSAIQSTIANYDNKAGVLLTAVGIVFGFSLFSVQDFSNKQDAVKVCIYLFGILYLIVFLTSIVLLVLIVFPRTRNKKEKRNKTDYSLYTEDLYEHLNKGDIDLFVKNGYKQDAILDQIKVCSRIAHTKEKMLKVAVGFIIAFAVCIVALAVCLVL